MGAAWRQPVTRAHRAPGMTKTAPSSVEDGAVGTVGLSLCSDNRYSVAMNIIRLLAAAVLTAALAIAVPTNVAANAASAAPAVKRCADLGVVSLYAEYGEDIVIPIGVELDTFETALCRYGKGGKMRIYKSVASTEREVGVLRAMAQRHGRPESPVLFCPTGEASGYLMELGSHYLPGGPNRYELAHHVWWTVRKAEAWGCEQYPDLRVWR